MPEDRETAREQGATLKTVTQPKPNLMCRGRYRAYATAQSKRAGAVISFEKWSRINCQ